jgi:hypothetical protein
VVSGIVRGSVVHIQRARNVTISYGGVISASALGMFLSMVFSLLTFQVQQVLSKNIMPALYDFNFFNFCGTQF